MNINEFAREVHQNAVEHGWWDGKRSKQEILALIHSEWSEALEEFRNDRPMHYMVCKNCGEPCMKAGCGDYIAPGGSVSRAECVLGDLDPKPEGIAVELIDGCIRILDFLANEGIVVRHGYQITKTQGMALPQLIATLHYNTASVQNDICTDGEWVDCNDLRAVSEWLSSCISEVFDWIRGEGFEPEELMLEKHAYNKTRPYKHGGKKC